MGNGQSGSANHVSNSPSFISGSKTKKGQVVVVRQATSGASNSEEDALLKRFTEIPKFYPILRSALNQPGLRDPPNLRNKVSARPIIKFCNCLQNHLKCCAQTVAMEQELLASAIKNVDRSIIALLNETNANRKRVERICNALDRLPDIQAQISNLVYFFQELIPMAVTLNEIMPEEKRLPPLKIDEILSEATFSKPEDASLEGTLENTHISPVDETIVVDTPER